MTPPFLSLSAYSKLRTSVYQVIRPPCLPPPPPVPQQVPSQPRDTKENDLSRHERELQLLKEHAVATLLAIAEVNRKAALAQETTSAAQALAAA